MTVRAWLAAVLVAIAAAGGYLASLLLGPAVPESEWGISCAPAIAVLEQKKRCGFVDLGELVTLEGRVQGVGIHQDGDRSLDIVPDPAFERLLWYGDRRNRTYIHVEFMPCERAYVDVESALNDLQRRFGREPLRVRVTGRWAYDGVDHRGESEEDLKTCLEGRQPDPEVGWVEIHPAYSVEILDGP